MTGTTITRKRALFALALTGAVFCALVCGCTTTETTTTATITAGSMTTVTPAAGQEAAAGTRPAMEPPLPANETMPNPPDGAERGAPDFATAAEQLGVTEDALREALGEPGEGIMTDFEKAAAALGVTVEELQEALGTPPDDQRPPDA